MDGGRSCFLLVAWVAGLFAALTPAAHGAPTPTPQGWSVERVRFEPLDEAAALAVDGVGSYRGAIELGRGSAGLAVVNDVGLEEYLRGVSEVPVRWPAEAQKAQAIAARTYAVYELLRQPATEATAAGADICATQACQVYAGLAKELRPGAAAWTAAVDATAGQLLLYQGRPILAKYSSTNGGRTVAGGRPYLRSVADPDDAASPYHQWQVTIPLSTLTSLFAPPGNVTAITRDGDTVVLGWEASDGTTGGQLVPAGDFRAKVNAGVPAPAELPLTVPSQRFTIVTDGDAAVVDGRGWGHGIGLSQYGALGKALRGMKAPEILASYYGGLKPVTVPATQLPGRIRVAVGSGLSGASITAPGRFRVLDGDGRVLALVASGAWRVLPGPGRQLRVVPPAADAGPPTVEVVSFDPPAPEPGLPVRLRLRLSAPSAVRVTYTAPGAPAGVFIDAGLRDRGETVVTLPPALVQGPAMARISAEAGAERTTNVDVPFTVTEIAGAGARPATASPFAPGVDGMLFGTSVLAAVLLVLVAGWIVRVGRRVS
jgi:SpoIID/LytB domain protein